EGTEIVGQRADAGALLEQAEPTPPAAVVADIRMPPPHTDEGLVAARAIRERHPQVAVLVLSQYVEASYALRLLEEDPAGTGYLLKDRILDPSALTDALSRLMAGECIVDQSIVARLLARARQGSPLDRLTTPARGV